MAGTLYQEREIVRYLLSITEYVSSALGSYPQRTRANAKDRSMCVTRPSNELCTAHVQSMHARCVGGAATAAREPNHGNKEKLAAQGSRCVASAVGHTHLL